MSLFFHIMEKENSGQFLNRVTTIIILNNRCIFVNFFVGGLKILFSKFKLLSFVCFHVQWYYIFESKM